MARDALTLAKDGENLAGVVNLAVLSAIAYADSITAKRARVVNAQNHRNAAQLLRDVLGDELPSRQERFYARILGWAEEVLSI
jgi:microcystin degradation protein MlrC